MTDGGKFKCVAANAAGVDEQDFDLDVYCLFDRNDLPRVYSLVISFRTGTN